MILINPESIPLIPPSIAIEIVSKPTEPNINIPGIASKIPTKNVIGFMNVTYQCLK